MVSLERMRVGDRKRGINKAYIAYQQGYINSTTSVQVLASSCKYIHIYGPHHVTTLLILVIFLPINFVNPQV